MKKLRFALALPFVLAALVLSLGCVSEQTRVAHALAIAGTGLESPARAAQEAEGHTALERLHAAGAARQDGEAALAAVDAKWKPVFDGIHLFYAVELEWLAALEAGDTGDFGQLLEASCQLVEAATPVAPSLIQRFAALARPFCALVGAAAGVGGAP